MNVDLIKMNKLECLVPKPKGGCVQWKEPKGWVALTSEREISNGILIFDINYDLHIYSYLCPKTFEWYVGIFLYKDLY